MKSYSDETGLLVGEVVTMQADEAVLMDGRVNYDKLRPIMFGTSSMSYRVVGPVVGKAYRGGLALKK